MEHRSVSPIVLHRMLDKAHREGVHILHTASLPDRPGIRGAQVSSSRPGHPPYTVLLFADGLVGCDCPGYEKFGYCKHWALTLDAAGLLPALAEEPGKAPAAADLDGPMPWDIPTVAVAAALQHPDRKAAALVDLSSRQAASAEPSPVRGRRTRKAAA